MEDDIKHCSDAISIKIRRIVKSILYPIKWKQFFNPFLESVIFIFQSDNNPISDIRVKLVSSSALVMTYALQPCFFSWRLVVYNIMNTVAAQRFVPLKYEYPLSPFCGKILRPGTLLLPSQRSDKTYSREPTSLEPTSSRSVSVFHVLINVALIKRERKEERALLIVVIPPFWKKSS